MKYIIIDQDLCPITQLNAQARREEPTIFNFVWFDSLELAEKEIVNLRSQNSDNIYSIYPIEEGNRLIDRIQNLPALKPLLFSCIKRL